jgi:hypothetical protein
MTPKLHKDRKNVHPSSETNTEEEEYMVHVMAISITFIQIQKKTFIQESREICDLFSKYGINPTKWKLFIEIFTCKGREELLL